MAVLKVRFLGMVDVDVPGDVFEKKEADGRVKWRSRTLQVTGKVYVGSLMIEAIGSDGSYPDGLDPPIATEDYIELHGVQMMQFLSQDGKETPISASYITLRAGDQVSFLGNFSIDQDGYNWVARLQPIEPVVVVARGGGGAARRSRLVALSSVHANHKS